MTVKTDTTKNSTPVNTKDSGRVHVGGGMMRYATPANSKDSGRVHVGGGMMHY